MENKINIAKNFASFESVIRKSTFDEISRVLLEESRSAFCYNLGLGCLLSSPDEYETKRYHINRLEKRVGDAEHYGEVVYVGQRLVY